VGDDLSVAVAREGVAAIVELGAQLAVVVDLAVEDNADAAVLGVDRRVAVDEVDDRQTVLRYDRIVARKRPRGVRAPVV